MNSQRIAVGNGMEYALAESIAIAMPRQGTRAIYKGQNSRTGGPFPRFSPCARLNAALGYPHAFFAADSIFHPHPTKGKMPYHCSIYCVSAGNAKHSGSRVRARKKVDADARKKRAERWIADCLGHEHRVSNKVDIGEYE